MTLNLHGKSIGSMDGLSPCVKLRQLDLSFNQVERIQGCAPDPARLRETHRRRLAAEEAFVRSSDNPGHLRYARPTGRC